MQNHYNLIYREEEREMMPTLKVCYLTPPFQTLMDNHGLIYTDSTLASAQSLGALWLVAPSLALPKRKHGGVRWTGTCSHLALTSL